MSRRTLSLLDWMVLRELGLPIAASSFALLQLGLLAQLLQMNDVVFGAAITPGAVARLTVALIPHFLVLALPLAFMLAVQLAIGRLAADGEVLALSAAGRHPGNLYRVPLALGLVLALFVAGLARWAEPWGLQQLNAVLNDVIKRNLQGGLAPGVFNANLPRFVVYVAGAEGDPKNPLWRGVLIEDAVGDGAPLLALAEAGRVEDAGGDALSLHLWRGELHRMEPRGETVARFAEGSFLVGVQDPVSRKNRFSGSEQGLRSDELRVRIRELEAAGNAREAARLRVELVRRWAVPLACLCFALLGVPLAISTRGAKAHAYLVTLLAYVGFYTLSRLGLALAEAGAPALLGGLLQDIAIAGAGAWFTVRLLRRGVGKPA